MLSASDFAEWVALLLPFNSNGGIAVLWIGTDESGTHGGPVLAVAGMFGTGSQWQSFRAAWTPYAAQYKDGYHAKEAKSGHNEALARLMRQHLMTGFSIRMSYADIREIVPPKVRSQTGEEYFIGMVTMTKLFALITDQLNVAEIAYVIEAGHRSAGNVGKMFDYLVTLPVGHPDRLKVHSASWVGKEEIITHPADLISNAWTGAYVQHPEAIALVHELGHDDFIKFHHYTRDQIAGAVKDTESALKRIKWLRKKRKRKDQ
jgi:hypothetical protein